MTSFSTCRSPRSLATATCLTGLVLICHSSVRGVVELLQDVFDYRLSVGTVHNIAYVAAAVNFPSARAINQQYDLSRISVGLLDEIFQASDPRFFVGADAESTFCFLLSPEQHCDTDTWGIRLLELVDQGYAPDANVADFGRGTPRRAQGSLYLEFPAAEIFFYALYTIGPLVRYLEKRAYEATGRPGPSFLERKQLTEAGRRSRRRKVQGLPQKLWYARMAEAKAIALADEVRC